MKMSDGKAKKALVPRLRFPEFRDAGPWEVKRLGDGHVAIFASERVPLCKLELSTYVSTENILPDFGGVTISSGLPKNGSFIKYQPNDILFANIRPYLKKVWLSNRHGATSNDVIVIRPAGSVNPIFIANIVKSERFIAFVMQGAKGVKMPRGDISLMKKYHVAVPIPPEQQKIADCLSSLDELIELETRQCEALKQHKKGLMQQLFPREGETIPRLRFPEFRDAGPWVVKRFGEIGTVSKGKGILKSDIVESGVLPCIRYGELYTQYSEVIREIVSFTNANSANLVLSEENDVIIPSSGETKEDIATASCVTIEGVALGGDLNIFRSRLNGVFLTYYVRGNLKTQISKVAQGDSVVHLYPTQLKKLKLAVPRTTQEQQKIADCLSSLDELIDLQSQKVETLKQHKKGLMQQLFPQEVA